MFWGDSPTIGTGFGNVIKFIIKHLPKKKYKITVLGLHHDNKAHDLGCKIYKVDSGAEKHDKENLKKIIEKENPDILFLIQDIWVLRNIVYFLKEANLLNKKRKIVGYMPVDAIDHDPSWYTNVDLIDKLVVYNEFGKSVVQKILPDKEIEIIEHGVDSSLFYPVQKTKSELRQYLFPHAPELDNSFVFLNAGRNQPRKIIDVSMRAFAEFAKNKDNVYLYMHCGYIDGHIDVLKLAKILGIYDKLLMTTDEPGLPNVPIEHLNIIYNFCDVGLNSGLGEGFGLPNAEHAAIGKPQIVPDHSALTDLYSDCGLLVPANIKISLSMITTTSKMILPEDMAQKMELLYSNKELYDDLAAKSREKFISEKYSWSYITKQWIDLFKKLK